MMLYKNKREETEMSLKKIFMTAGVFVAAVAVFAVIWFGDSAKTKDNESDYSMDAGDYSTYEWYEKEERDDCTVTKYITAGSPSILVEFYKDEYPVNVTITRGSKTTLVYAADYSCYDVYIEYRDDRYVISEDFANLEDIIPLAFDWADGTFMGTYSESEDGTLQTDEDGNTYMYDENGNKVIYQYSDEI